MMMLVWLLSFFALRIQSAGMVGMGTVCAMQRTFETCRGPSAGGGGSICMWNGEDGICTEVEGTSNADDVCKQWARNPTLCANDPTCFWDSSDAECTSRAEAGFPMVLPPTGTAGTSGSAGTPIVPFGGYPSGTGVTGNTGAGTSGTTGSGTAGTSGTTSSTTGTSGTAGTTTGGSTAVGSGSYQVAWGESTLSLSSYQTQLRESFAQLVGLPSNDVSVSFAGVGENAIVTYSFPQSTFTDIRLSSPSFTKEYIASVNHINGLTYSASANTGTTSGSTGTTGGTTGTGTGTTGTGTTGTGTTGTGTTGTGTTGTGTAGTGTGTSGSTSPVVAVPKMCRSIMSPTECWGLGTSQDVMGHAVCAWDSEDNLCLSIETDTPEGICQIYNYRNDWAGCSASPHCYYDQSDVECTENKEMEVPPAGSSLVMFGEDGYPEGEFEFDHEMEKHETEYEHPEYPEFEGEYERPEYGGYSGVYPTYTGGMLKKTNEEGEAAGRDWAPLYYGLAGFLSATILVCGVYCVVHRNRKPTFEDVYQDIALDYGQDYSSRDLGKVEV